MFNGKRKHRPYGFFHTSGKALVGFLLVCTYSIAPQADTADTTAAKTPPFLWQVSQPERPGSKPVYLFGTIHSAHPQLNQLPASVNRVFNQADAYYGELAMTPATLQAAAKGFSSPQPGALLEQLSHQQQQRVQQVLSTIHPGLSLQNFADMKLWAFVATLSLLEDQVTFGNAPAMDMRLYNEAVAAGKHTGGLETIDEQIAVFERFSTDEIMTLLDATLDYMEARQAAGKSTIEETYAAYRSGDVQQFGKLMDAQLPLPPALDQKLERHLLTERNHRMAARINQLLEQQPDSAFFFAVGAAHYAGPESIQALLRAKGYRVSRVTD